MIGTLPVVVFSFTFFGLARILLCRFSRLPAAVLNSGRSDVIWRWYNVWVSLFHAMLAGPGSLYCLIKEPKMLNDLNQCELAFATTLIAISTGYFFYDALDTLIYVPIRQSVAVLAHHFVVFSCFALVVKTGLYVSYAIVCLLVEVNTIFLHTRQLLRIAKYHQSIIYTINMFSNFITYILFRFVSIAWLIHWTWVNQETIDQPYLAVLVFSLPIMYLINIGLFLQVLSKDVPYFLSTMKGSNLKSLSSWGKIANGQSYHNGCSIRETSRKY